jgi:hypothetical protein
MNIKDCFKEDFTGWLLKSNNPSVSEKECLKEILDILLREPQADYFWYTYPVVGLKGTDKNSRLIYSLPKSQVVPSDSLRVDRDKVKAFLRDYKIESILNK